MELLATKEELERFTGVQEDEFSSQAELFLGSASDIIRNYLGYDPIRHTEKKYYNGNDTNILRLGSKPIQKINSVFIGDLEIDTDSFDFDDDTLIFKDDVFTAGVKNILIDFDSGFEKVPDLIKLTCLRIAAILQTESDNNIGITSKSFGESGSRTFYNFTNFQKYLLPISRWKII